MHFIEQIFATAPDRGSGGLEFFLLAVPLVGIAYLALRARHWRGR